MSKYSELKNAVTVRDIQAARESGKRLSMVTCYDAAFAKLVDKTMIDMVLVGDSLGNVILGHDSTIPVTVSDMIHHASAVSRVLKRPFLAVDMPFMSYKVSVKQALLNATKLVQEGGAQAVKVEGGKEVCEAISAIVEAGIPVIGHLGLTPQSVHQTGGYRVQGRELSAARKLTSDAKALEAAGAFCIVLELVPAKLAEEVTSQLTVPTIGIGAGAGCTGQVLVLQDLLGFDSSFSPKFLKRYADLDKIITDALNQYDQDVKEGVFPSADHSF